MTGVRRRGVGETIVAICRNEDVSAAFWRPSCSEPCKPSQRVAKCCIPMSVPYRHLT
jgi:hypothetical protein